MALLPNLNFMDPLPWGIYHSPVFLYLSLATVLNFVLQVEFSNDCQELGVVKLRSFHSAAHYLLKEKACRICMCKNKGVCESNDFKTVAEMENYKKSKRK